MMESQISDIEIDKTIENDKGWELMKWLNKM